MAPTVVSVTSSASFLALVPRLLECTPSRSLVLVPFTESRSLGAMRVDLPPAGASASVESIASTIIGMACKVARTDAVALVVYTDDDVAGPAALPHRALVDAAIARADICGLRVVDALVVGPDGWDSYLSPSSSTPHPLSEVTAPPQGEPGSGLVADQFTAAELPRIDSALSRGVLAALRRIERVLDGAHDRRALPRREHAAAVDPAAAAVADPPVLLEDALASAPAQLDAAQLAAVAFCLDRPSLRDVALMQWAADLATGDATLHAQTAYRRGTPFPEDLARPMWGEGARPDPDRLRRALELCRFVAAALPRERRPGALSACAWLAWATGRSSHAAVYAETALEIDADHGLSAIVLDIIDAGRLPEWVFERPTSPAGTGSSPGYPGR
ncbi:DUF4192 family protein [Microbacterium testaceum]|uniref:DUF4192 family protein n=1 Tax=Microbacterium testaceum TaxID=2033 RepID=UPI0025B132DE|nr:DUF4192 family protein [Microbacterium testaceum]WJS91322.1 DUF4192 domain-containing protein [Microbacterium testaceum]